MTNLIRNTLNRNSNYLKETMTENQDKYHEKTNTNKKDNTKQDNKINFLTKSMIRQTSIY